MNSAIVLVSSILLKPVSLSTFKTLSGNPGSVDFRQEYNEVKQSKMLMNNNGFIAIVGFMA